VKTKLSNCSAKENICTAERAEIAEKRNNFSLRSPRALRFNFVLGKPFARFAASLGILIFVLLSLAQTGSNAADESDLDPGKTDVAATRHAKVLIVLAGDSTVSLSSGWGPGFAEHLVGDIQCIDLAANGRSSKSFRDEGRWQKCLDLKPDYILIQFGHNDEKTWDPKRGTVPETTYRAYMTQFVDEARAAGIRPVLVTSVSRRYWGKDGKIHSDLYPYVNVVKEIAAEKDVPLIDLHARSIALYEKLGKKTFDNLSATKPATTKPSTRPIPTTVDNTHFNKIGSEIVGQIVAEELAKAVPELAGYIR
jgi:lysophospholipase L1-like esterase